MDTKELLIELIKWAQISDFHSVDALSVDQTMELMKGLRLIQEQMVCQIIEQEEIEKMYSGEQ